MSFNTTYTTITEWDKKKSNNENCKINISELNPEQKTVINVLLDTQVVYDLIP